ncbi:hypothetical protein Poli38472_001073 [Pythium oligandrum]|uniref:Microsomal glutathione S-transferase 1 n=1 Tax=Pythium oligandrum TaxID=41045 RepID=A0A8K1CS86_PYTOL|nr:hypothetical protein Poli38472_001073 [Pythium oligandrum]|eukprot:TMW68917.1 hypothetical protein Poli38472_001073 [Pythium oligandrum]
MLTIAMTHDPESTSVQTFAICTVALYIKFFITARFQAAAKYNVGGRPPEDAFFARLAGKEPIPQSYGTDQDEDDLRSKQLLERERRWDRIIMNDLECIPFSLLVFAAALFLECNDKLQTWAMIIFTIARIAYTFVYAMALQPHRSLVALIAALAVFVSIGDIIAKVLALNK